MTRLRNIGLVALVALLPAFVTRAEAVPLLQLDIVGGVYDPVTQTIVGSGGPFTVYAILTPQTNASAAEITALLNDQYFISAALTPQVSPGGASMGSFTLGLEGGSQSVVDATSGMTYGAPPLESAILQGFDAGDLPQHGIFPTSFTELGFNFSAARQTATYNTADNPGGPALTGTGSYYAAITGDRTLLSALYGLHFDLYNTEIRNCAARRSPSPCSDVDVDSFAPFSHDAEVRASVPEPGVALLMLLGFAIGGRRVLLRAARS